MNPRLTSSKKWTPFPAAYQSQIEEVFQEAFAEQMKKGKLVIEGRIYPEEVCLRVGYLENGRLVQNNFEISMGYNSKKADAVERIHNCIDAAASMMNEYIQSEGEVEFPRTWRNYDFEGLEIWVQYTTNNTDLEAEADRLLGLEEKALVVEEAESEDALALAELKNLEDDEDGPTIPASSQKKRDQLH